MVAAEEETSERLHCVHAMVWYTEIEADGCESRNWFVILKHNVSLDSL